MTDPKSGSPGQSTSLVVRLAVFRRLDNRSEGLPDDSPRALELHNLRKEALHEALNSDAWRVTDWGVTDDTTPHELAEIVVAVASNPHLHALAISAATWAGLEFAKAGLGTLATEAVKALLAKLLPQQKQQKVLDFTITLPDGTIIRSDQAANVTVVQ